MALDDFVICGDPNRLPNDAGRLSLLWPCLTLLVFSALGYFFSPFLFSAEPVTSKNFRDVFAIVGVFSLFGLVHALLFPEFRLDGVKASRDGLFIGYSYMPVLPARYVNRQEFFEWGDVVAITIADEEMGEPISITLRHALETGERCMLLNFKNASEAARQFHILKKLAAREDLV